MIRINDVPRIGRPNVSQFWNCQNCRIHLVTKGYWRNHKAELGETVTVHAARGYCNTCYKEAKRLKSAEAVRTWKDRAAARAPLTSQDEINKENLNKWLAARAARIERAAVAAVVSGEARR